MYQPSLLPSQSSSPTVYNRGGGGRGNQGDSQGGDGQGGDSLCPCAAVLCSFPSPEFVEEPGAAVSRWVPGRRQRGTGDMANGERLLG